jgi:thiamine-monophosphate kinase
VNDCIRLIFSSKVRAEVEAAKKQTVADFGEKRIIREFIAPVCKADSIAVGVGDDAAVIEFPPGKQLVISTDKIPEDLLAIQLGLMDAFHHGRYLATVNISDIAAMGGQPLGLLCTLALPDSFEIDYLRSFISGFVAGGSEWNTPVVGGDTGWGSAVCVSATAFGAVEPGRVLLRSGAKIGDRLFVSGLVGGFGTALAYFIVARERGMLLSETEETWLRDRLIRPSARVDIGRALSSSGLCTSCIDITDGVGQTLIELSQASQKQLEVDVERLPLHSTTKKVADFLKCDFGRIAFGIGLDLELMGTSHSNADLKLPTQPYYIGRVVDGEPNVVLKHGDRKSELPVAGWQHFKGSAMDLVRQMYSPL